MEKELRNKKGRKVLTALSVLIAAMFMVTLFTALPTEETDNDHEHDGCCDETIGASASDSNIKMIAAGGAYTLILRNDGTLWAIGNNANGQLGNGTITNSSTLVQVKGLNGTGYLTDVKAIVAGVGHSLALKNDGTVWAWGINTDGQLGDGTSGTGNYKSTPVQVKGLNGTGYLTDITAIATGREYSFALKSDGTLLAWGYNLEGQLGDGTNTSRSTPVYVKSTSGTNLTGVKAIAAGAHHTLALKNDGTVWAWGYNDNGQLGDGTTTNRLVPVQVKGAGGTGYLTGVKAIAAGNSHSLALKTDGTVWAWGNNNRGQIGDGTLTDQSVPVQVKGGGAEYLTDVKAIGAGSAYSVALKNDETLWAWGWNEYSQLGDGTTTDRSKAVQVKGVGGTGYLTGVKAITVGTNHSLALKTDGTTSAWGYNLYGQLGDGTTVNKSTPVHMHVFGTTYLSSAAGHWNVCSCGANSSTVAHTYGAWVVDTAAAHLTNGSRHRDCTVCSYRQTEALSAEGHSFTTLKYNTTEHWYECKCGTKSGNKAHTYGAWVVDTAAGHATAGSRHRDCTGCSYRQTEAIAATGHTYSTLKTSATEHWYECSCGAKSGVTAHTFSTAWTVNGTDHWHECSCGVKKDSGSHTFGAWVVDTAASHTSDGSKHRNCTVCGHTQREAIPAGHTFDMLKHSGTEHWYECSCGTKKDITGHTFSAWTVDSLPTQTTEGSKHRTCAGCSYVQTVALPIEEHTFGNWIIDNAAGHLMNGSKHRDCTECSYTETVTIPAEGHSFNDPKDNGPEHWYECVCGEKTVPVEHTFGTAWSINGAEHWHACSCGARKDVSDHAFGSWTTDIPASHTSDGSKHRTCTVCSYMHRETIPAGHIFSELKNDGTEHWYECSCGTRSGTASHTYGTWIIDVGAGHLTDGSKHRICAECGHVQNEIIYAEGHSFDDPVNNGPDHWYECSCGERTQAQDHVFGWKHNGTHHWTECECGAVTGNEAHSFGTERVHNASEHWYECKCGAKKDVQQHKFVSNGHGSSVCGCGAVDENSGNGNGNGSAGSGPGNGLFGTTTIVILIVVIMAVVAMACLIVKRE